MDLRTRARTWIKPAAKCPGEAANTWPSGMDGRVERFEGRGRLGWWANSAKVFGVEIAVAVAVDGGDWTGQGRPGSDNHDEREGLCSYASLIHSLC